MSATSSARPSTATSKRADQVTDRAAARVGTPGWTLRTPTGGAFTAENAAAQLGLAFQEVTGVRPAGAGPVIISDASVAAFVCR
jgi:hypothetical protein